MDDGLIQFLVIAFFIIVSMMDGAARKRKKEAQRLGRSAHPDQMPGVDDDLGEATRASESAARREREARTQGGARAEGVARAEGAAQSSEGIVPEDLWKEIAALARGEAPAPHRGPPRAGPQSRKTTSRPARAPDSDLDPWEAIQQEIAKPEHVLIDEPAPTVTPTVAPSGDLQGGYLHADQALTHREHTQVARRVPQLPAEPQELVPNVPGMEPRRTLVAGSLVSGLKRGAGRSLQEAIVLAEVLNRPLALRDDSDLKLPGGG